VLLEASGYGSEMFEFVEEPFDKIAFSVELFVEFWDVHPIGHRLVARQSG
jgi:hypothetical protein